VVWPLLLSFAAAMAAIAAIIAAIAAVIAACNGRMT
jgi:hypothetical protein